MTRRRGFAKIGPVACFHVASEGIEEMVSKNPCEDCDGKCCRYFALEIDKPTTKRDFEDIRWYLCHENTKIFVEDGRWYLEVHNECRHLDENNRCRIYPRRPRLCRAHSPGNCEGRRGAGWGHELELTSDEELERHLKEREKKNRRKRSGSL